MNMHEKMQDERRERRRAVAEVRASITVPFPVPVPGRRNLRNLTSESILLYPCLSRA